MLVRAVLPLLDPGSCSPAERRARLRLHDAGFTALRHGVVVRDRAGGWLAEPDLADELAKVAVQHDGLVHLQGDPERGVTEPVTQRGGGPRQGRTGGRGVWGAKSPTGAGR